MRGALLIIILSLLWMNLFVSCRSSRVPSSDNHDQFLFVTIKSEPGVIEGLLASCSCLELINMDVLQVDPVLIDITGSAVFPVKTVRLLIRMKQQSNSDYVLGRLLRMKEVVSINFK